MKGQSRTECQFCQGYPRGPSWARASSCTTSTTSPWVSPPPPGYLRTIYMTVRNNSDAQKLQDDLRRLEEWEDTWMMKFHPYKCEVVSITRKKSPVIFPYTLHGHTLDHVQVIKYLGVRVSNGMRWDAHINNITGKANRTLGFLRRNLNISNIKIKQQAYHSLVRPILEYSLSVWNPYTDTRAAYR